MTAADPGAIIVVLGPGSPSPARIVRAATPYRVVFATARAAAGDAARESTAVLAASLAPLIEVGPDEPGTAVPLLAAHRPVGITTFADGALELTAELAAALGLDYHSADAVAALTGKSRQRARLADAGVDRTRSVVVTDRAELEAALSRCPAVVKPQRGQGSVQTYLVRDPGHLPADLPVGPDRPFVVEEYLAGRDEHPFGDYVSVETVSVDGRVHVLGVTGKLALLPPFREQAAFVPARLDPAESAAVADLAARAVSAVGVARGLAHTEIKLTPDGPRVIEVNGRLGGFIDELYARAFGLDLLAIELALAAGASAPLDHEPAGQVYYQYFNLGPTGGGTFVGTEGVAAVRALAGVTGYRPLVARGASIPAGVSTTELDLLTGHAADHDAMLEDIDKALAELTFTIAQDGANRVWKPGREGLECLS
ncbi:hypothetical protein KDK95_05365 [Actinospica sp. MGRD01-02]|uniref:ATP-grasp domain-containing protein n=1 Tax=Actinospica acidithermotolerans TaxID=2828514 RepID=A0A941E857_9ACTN|nr:ATP-grasp domain-containing protein [Actinospica acidithermotolerans]MBR7825728.1 hypothetical protein [Actinospica acidithermotolerans]